MSLLLISIHFNALTHGMMVMLRYALQYKRTNFSTLWESGVVIIIDVSSIGMDSRDKKYLVRLEKKR
jgi:hypothetical protein